MRIAEEIFEKTNAVGKGLEDFLIKEIRENKLESDFYLLFHFFENLHVCTCAKLCDDTTVRRFFAKYAYDYRGSACPYLTDQRRRLKDESLGRGIESIAKSHQTGQVPCNTAFPEARPDKKGEIAFVAG